MNIEELKRLAEAATPGPWYDRAGVLRGTGGGIRPIATIYNGLNSEFIAAANPAAVLELIRQRDELLAAMKEIRTLGHNYTQVSHRVWKIADAAIAKEESKT